MGQPNEKRVQILEEGRTFRGDDLAAVLTELDKRTSCADLWSTISRDGNDLIDQIDWYTDPGKTQLTVRRTFSRVTGGNGIEYLSGWITIFYNDDATEDSRVITTVNRDGNDRIIGCDDVFTTGETIPC